MSLWEMYKAKRLGYADDLWTSLIGHRLGGYSWISTDYEQTPYIYRAMPNMSHYYNREIMDAVVGGSVAWNQLVRNGDFASTSNWTAYFGATFTVNNNVATIVGNGNASGSRIFQDTSRAISHKYLFTVDVKTDGTVKALINLDNVSSFTGKEYSPSTQWGTLAGIADSGTNTTQTYMRFHIRVENNVEGTVYARNAILIDLTLLFGSTIADYIYSLEQATAGSGVAWLKANFPKMFGQYNPYDSGSIQSVSGLVSHTTKDASDNIIGEYALDSTVTLRGIPKLDNGKPYYDGDVYEADGTVTRKYGVVDLGTLNWDYTASQQAMVCNELKTLFGSGQNIICARYKTTDSLSSSNATNPFSSQDKVIGVNKPPTVVTGNFVTGALVIKDTAYTDAQTFKASLSGVYLVYELATPTTETAQPFTKTQKCDSGGTEEFITSGIVSVGHKSKYAEK